MAMPKRERRRSSVSREQTEQALKNLPMLKDTAAAKRHDLFKQKLELCSVRFNFDDMNSNKRGKELKRSTLLELVDFVNNSQGQKVFSEPGMMAGIAKMVGANIFRSLPPQVDDFDPEEDEPVLESAWPHLQVVYEFLLRFIVSSEVNAKVAKKRGIIDHAFCLHLIALFDSEDPRERDYLKTILHRIYGKFMAHRAFIRRGISNTFYKFVYEFDRHNGVGELLEILGSIINGFALPLKQEHLRFLERALIPLHKPKCVTLYHQQLSYCITQYAEKDVMTSVTVVLGLVKFWPWSVASKQVNFLNELEEIFELMMPEQFETVHEQLMRCLARCIGSPHFQVAERALFLWNNEHLVNSFLVHRNHLKHVLPYIIGALVKNANGHWNPTVEGLSQNVVKMYTDLDLALFDKLQGELMEANKTVDGYAEAGGLQKIAVERHLREQKWEQLLRTAGSS